MDTDTRQKIDRADFDELFQHLHETHKPIKAQLTADHLAALGRLIVKFARLEMTVSQYVSILAGVDQQTGNILTCEIPFRALTAILSSLWHQRLGPSPDMDILIRAISDAESVRNRIIHSTWAGGKTLEMPAARVKFTAKASKGLQFQHDTYSLADLNEIADWVDKIDTAVEASMFDCLVSISEGRKPGRSGPA